MRGPLLRACAAAMSVALAACTGPKGALRPQLRPSPVALCGPARPCGDSVSVTYLGVSGFVIRVHDSLGTHALLTAPSVTHPRELTVALGLPLRPDTALIRERLGGGVLGGVRTILVGHSHYDHLLDVPFVARALAPAAAIYGSATAGHILAGDSTLRGRVHVIDSVEAGTTTRAGTWHHSGDGRFRFMALESSHAENLGRYTLAPGRVDRDYERLPRTAFGWRQGDTYAYLIDVLRPDSTPAFRIFYQDAAAEPELAGLPALAPRDRRPVDLAILCAGNFDNAPRYPTAFLEALRPGWAVIGHWENFFRSPTKPTKPIPLLDTRELERRVAAVQGARWTTPEPMATMVFRY